MEGPGPGAHAAHMAVVSRLARLALYPATSPGIAARADRMRASLDRPVRVTVFGMPGTGKSDVVNLLAGRRVLPDIFGLPTTELSAGPDPLTEAVLPDGTRVFEEKLPDEETAAKSPVFLRVSVPDAPGLSRFQLLEVVTDGTLPDLAAAARWAMPRTDIAMWCTLRLGDADRAVWEATLDVIKDHAVLVLTGAQGPVPSGRPIRSGLPEGFRAAWPIWRARLGQALDSGDAEAFAASGAAALVAAVSEIAQGARSMDIEAAEVFLARYEPPELRPVAPRDAPVRADDPVPAPEAPGQSHGQPVLPEPVQSSPAVALRVPEQAVAALRLLRDRAAALLRDVAPVLDAGPDGAQAAAGDVLAACAGIAEDVARVLAAEDPDFDEDGDLLQPLRDAVDEVADMAVLMGIEGGPDRAADAAALLAQLRETFDRVLGAARKEAARAA